MHFCSFSPSQSNKTMLHWFALICALLVHSSHLVYEEQNVLLNQHSLLVLSAFETVTLQSPLLLQPNRQYGVFWKFSNNATRSYGYALNQNSMQHSLSITSSSSSNISIDQDDSDYYLSNNIGPTTTSELLLSFKLQDVGFGQTFHSGSGGFLTQFVLMVGGNMNTENDAMTTMYIYDLSNITNEFPLIQEDTLQPSAQPLTYQPSSNPTPSPTYPSSINPTSNPSNPTYQPSSASSSINPDLMCSTLLIPDNVPYDEIVCQQLSESEDGLLSNIYEINLVDENGTIIEVSNLSSPIEFFIPLLSNHLDCQSEAVCSWISNSSDWSSSGCTTEKAKDGRYCRCDHLTSFALVLRYKQYSTDRSSYQIVSSLCALLIFIASSIQCLRAAHAKRSFTKVVQIHLGIAIGSLVLFIIPLLTSTFPTYPAVAILMASIANCIELTCYLFLLHLWSTLSYNQPMSSSMRKMLVLLLSFCALIVIGFPISTIITFDQPDVQLRLAQIGSYSMSLVTTIFCLALMITGFKMRRSFIITNRDKSICHLPNRILIGSTLLSVTVFIQSVLWSVSINAQALENICVSEGLELGFDLATYIGFITLLCLFCFGIKENREYQRPSIARQISSRLQTASPRQSLHLTTPRPSHPSDEVLQPTQETEQTEQTEKREDKEKEEKKEEKKEDFEIEPVIGPEDYVFVEK